MLIEMDSSAASKFLFLFLLSIPIVCSSGSLLSTVKDFVQQEHKASDEHGLMQKIGHDFINPPITTFPNAPVTNPVTTPSTGTLPQPDASTPGIVTVPSANPVTITPTPADSTPISFPPPVPVTNPVTTPSTAIPGGQPVTNPVTTPTGGVPVPVPVPVTNNAPAIPGQSWCVVRNGVPEIAVQAALDYACGIGTADCSAIQQGASCYNPNTLANHASYAFNSYYQRNPVQTSCDFGGTAMITNVNPSTGPCIFPTSSPSIASPVTVSPATTTTTAPIPTTASSSGATPTTSGAPPSVLNAGNPALGDGVAGYGDSPPITNAPSISISSSLQPFICCIIFAICIITGRLVLDI